MFFFFFLSYTHCITCAFHILNVWLSGHKPDSLWEYDVLNKQHCICLSGLLA